MKTKSLLLGALLTGALPAFGATAFTGSYLQTFDSMGTAGTTAPAGWSVFSMAGGHDTFAPADSVTPGVDPNMTAGTLTAANTLTAGAAASQKGSVGYNFATTASSTDRSLGTSPSGNAAEVLELTLSNTTGSDIGGIALGYDIRRFSTTTNNNTSYNSSLYKGVEEFPGYRLFYSLDGTTWTKVSALNPTLTGASGVVVPNSIGVTNVAASTIAFNNVWAAGTNLTLAWLDDNAQSPSPDQLLGLDNVTVSAIPEPSTYAVVLGALVLGFVALRRRKA